MSAARRAAERKPRRTRRAPPSRGDKITAKTEAVDVLESLEVAAAPPPEVEESDLRDVGFLRKSARDFGRTLRQAAQWKSLRYTPYGVTPIALFAVLAIVSGFDDRILNLALPEVVQDLNINAVSLIQILNLVSFFFIFIVLGLSYVLDRRKRVPWVAGGAVASGAASLLTPTSKGIYTLGAYQVGSGAGGEASSIPSFSLVLDYYPVEQRGRVFAMSATLRRVGALFAPWMVGLIIINHGWRFPFYITGPSLIVVGVLMFLILREPVRGYMERRALGMSEADSVEAEPPPSFGQAWRTVWGIRTLRRIFVANIFANVGDSLYGLFYALFLFQEYHLNILQRGKMLTLVGVFSAVGGFIGGGVIDSLIRRRPQRVLVYTGVVGVLEAVSIGIVASTPPLWVVIIFNCIFGFGFALTGPARSVFYGQIVPANMRTLGLNAFVLAGIPSTIIFGLIAAHEPTWGLSGMIFACAPFFLADAVLTISAAGFFERDMRSALASQSATAEYKKAKAAGAVKLLVARDIDVEYDGVQVLFGVDFEVEEGEIVALLGTNGAGKSTLLKALSGSHEASSGAVVYDGRDVTHVPPYEIVQRGVVHMPGGRGIFPGLTVRDNLNLATWTHTDAEGPYERGPLKDVDLDEVLGLFPALRERLDTPAGALSGGEQQMVSLAQAFLQRPRLLLIDELSLGLSPTIVQQLLDAVKAINERGVTIVVVEQSVNVALTIAERAVFMEKGEIKFVGKTKDLLARPDILRAVYVKGTGALTSQPGTSRAKRPVEETRRVVLEVENLVRSFGGVRAVNDVSFALRDEEILGLIGPNGAGKTTIFDLISGFLAPDSGRVVYEGNDVTSLGPDERSRLQIVRRFQEARLFPSLTVYETLLVALDRRQDVRNMALVAMQLPQVRASERRARRRADQLIELLGLEAVQEKFVKELSTGLRRVTDLACVLATEPRVLLLDEPSSGIAQAEAESLGPVLLRVRRETGCSILIIEHDMPLISRVADELLALDQGKVITRGTPEAVLNDPHVIESYLGTSEAAIRRSGARA